MPKSMSLSIALLMLMMLIIPGISTEVSSEPFSYLGEDERHIVSPYDGIDFDNITQYRAALHTHTTESDGRKTPSESISAHQNAGYDILAITDHWTCTQYSGNTTMLLINGSEPTHRVHHTVSLFTDFESLNENAHGLEETMQEVASRDGIQFFAHPYSYIDGIDSHVYGPDWYQRYFNAYPHLLGMEVSAFSGYESSVAYLWDVLLVHYGQSRPIYAFGASDYHGFFINTASTYILAQSLDTVSVKQAIMDGKMFYTSKGAGAVPRINGLDINGDTITVSTDGTDIRWINKGVVLGTDSSYTFSGVEISNYIRLEIWNGSSMIGTQAFFLTGAPLVLDTDEPTAHAGDNMRLSMGELWTFDGRLSSDNIGLMNYTWTFYDVTEIVLYGAMPTYQFQNPGYYEVTLTVTDVANNTDMAVIVVQVEGPEDVPLWIWFMMMVSTVLVLTFFMRVTGN